MDRPARPDRGFTLVELLIVIVILGVLATVTVFAVRGITDDAAENACATEFRQLRTAQEMHHAQTGSYGDEADLVGNGAIVEASARFDTAPDGDGFAITPVDTACTQVAAGGGAPVPAPPAPIAGTADPPTAITYAGIPAAEYGGSGADELLVFGRGEAAADWAATTAAGMDVARRVTFFDIDDVSTVARLDSAIDRANNTPPTAYALFVDDDGAAFDAFPSFADALVDVLTTPGYDDGPVLELDRDGARNLSWAFSQFP